MLARWREGALMPKRSTAHLYALLDADESPTYPADLTPALQATLAILADLDRQHEEMRLKLERWSGPEAIKQRFFEQLEARHQCERKPVVQHLAALHARIRSMLALESRPVQ